MDVEITRSIEGDLELYLDGQRVCDVTGATARMDGKDIYVGIGVQADSVRIQMPDGTKKQIVATPPRKVLVQLGDVASEPVEDPVNLVEAHNFLVPSGSAWNRFWGWARLFDGEVLAGDFEQVGWDRIKTVLMHLQEETGKSAEVLMKHWNLTCICKGWLDPVEEK